jgi:hypothetical protein
MTLAISPHFTDHHFQTPLRIEDKIALFADRVRGWQLDIAQSLESHHHAGFAVLAIVSSYFEMISKYERGHMSNKNSKAHFKLGVRSVLELHLSGESTLPDYLIDLLYEEVRCGMYHAGMTGPRVRISDAPGIPMIQLDQFGLTLDPHQLVRALQEHFSGYVARLNDPANVTLRRNFEKRFDAGHAGKRLGR